MNGYRLHAEYRFVVAGDTYAIVEWAPATLHSKASLCIHESVKSGHGVDVSIGYMEFDGDRWGWRETTTENDAISLNNGSKRSKAILSYVNENYVFDFVNE